MVQLPHLFTFLQILTNKKKEVNMKNNERPITTIMFPDVWLALQVLINCYNSEGDTIRHCQATCEALHDRSLEVDGCWNCPDYDPIPHISFNGRESSLNSDVFGILKASWGVEGFLDRKTYLQHDWRTGENIPVTRSNMKDWLDMVNESMSEHFKKNEWGEWFDLPYDIFIEWALYLFDKMWK